MAAVKKYIETHLMRHGWDESWIKDDLTLDELIILRRTVDAEIDERIARIGGSES